MKGDFEVNQSTFSHLISQDMEYIRLDKVQPIFKIETSV